MKIASKVAQGDSEFDLSGLGVIAHAFGVLTGGMATGCHHLSLGNTDLTLVIAQMLLLDGGEKRIVTGSAPSSDDQSTFLAMSDGEIERMIVVVGDGEIVAESHKAHDDEIPDCIAYDMVNEAMAAVAGAKLQAEGLTDDKDEIRGTVLADVHAAIRNYMSGDVTMIVRQEGKVDRGYIVRFEDIKSSASDKDAVSQAMFREMTAEEVAGEKKKRIEFTKSSNPFGQTTGIA